MTTHEDEPQAEVVEGDPEIIALLSSALRGMSPEFVNSARVLCLGLSTMPNPGQDHRYGMPATVLETSGNDETGQLISGVVIVRDGGETGPVRIYEFTELTEVPVHVLEGSVIGGPRPPAGHAVQSRG